LPTFYHPPDVDEVLIPYPVRHKAICKLFENSNVDVINFQEVFTYRNLRLLKNNLPSYKYVLFVPYAFGPRGALVTFSKIPLGKVGYASYFSSAMEADRSNLPKLSLLRSTLKGMMVLQAKSLPLTIINTHLLYNVDLDWSPSSRSNSIQKAQLGKLEETTKAQYKLNPRNNVVVAGDLNVETGSELIKGFLDASSLYDFFEDDDKPSFHNEYVPSPKFRHRIDYLLTNNQKSASASGTRRIFTEKVKLANDQTVYLTDHQGLVVTMSLMGL